MNLTKKQDFVIAYASKRGVIRSRDADAIGVSARYLDKLVEKGVLQKVGRGLFSLVDYDWTEHHSLATVSAYMPNCVVCLLSALQFHGIGTQLPNSVWIAMPNFAPPPKGILIPVEVVHMNSRALAAGVETHLLEGIPVHVFSAAKTVVDCFKYLSSVGLDVCLEALQESLRRKMVTRDELFEYARTNRVWNTMRPYMEAIS